MDSVENQKYWKPLQYKRQESSKNFLWWQDPELQMNLLMMTGKGQSFGMSCAVTLLMSDTVVLCRFCGQSSVSDPGGP